MKILIGFAFLCLLLVLFRDQWLLGIGDFLIVEDELQPADVIHVIAGDDYRTEHAIQLYKQGYAKTLFFTGGWCTYHNYYHGKHAQEVSLAQGVPLNAIAFDESTVTSTYMEAEVLKKWITQNSMPIHSVIVVSDPFHMRRARWTSKKVLGENIEIQMAPVSFSLTPLRQDWWNDQQSRQTVLEEYVKLVYYLARYQFAWGIFRA